MKLLVIEDEADLCAALAKGLRKCGYLVDTSNDGLEGLEMAHINSYDLIVLDLNLPGIDGMDILTELRRDDLETRVLILSARTGIEQRIRGLDSGANDYLVKPFDFGELAARVRSLLRRSFSQENSVVEFFGMSFDTITRSVHTGDGETVALSPKELAILEYLLLRRGRPVCMEELIEHVWEDDSSLFSNAVKVHVSTLRKKLSAHCEGEIIRWVRGVGYVIGEART